MKKAKTPNSLFDTEQEAQDFKDANHLHVRVPEKMATGKWALVFPLKAHVTVVPHTQAA